VKKQTTCPCGCGTNITPGFALIREDIIKATEKTPGFYYKSTSLARCAKHNKEIGGKPNSGHVRGVADDVETLTSQARYALIKVLILYGITRIFINFERNIVHWDIGKQSDGYFQKCIGKD